MDWRSVPDEHASAWRERFDVPGEGHRVAGDCPICGMADLHRWFEGGEMGSVWEWCSGCGAYEHARVRVPAWWTPDLDVDTTRWTAEPDGPHAAVERAKSRA